VTRCAYCRTASSTTRGTCPQCGAPASEPATAHAYAVHDPCEGTTIWAWDGADYVVAERILHASRDGRFRRDITPWLRHTLGRSTA
jgi:predicted amidophosphoribosyltransferase